jgi:hypothetical protein
MYKNQLYERVQMSVQSVQISTPEEKEVGCKCGNCACGKKDE